MIVAAILAVWLASVVPFCWIAYCAGRDEERARQQEDLDRRDRVFGHPSFPRVLP